MTEPAVWRGIFARIRSQVPNAPDALIRQEIFNIMVDFTQGTNLWQEDVPINVVPNQLTYPFSVTSGVTYRLMVVYKDGDQNKNWVDSGITMRVPGVLQLTRGQSEAVLWHAVVAKACRTPLVINGTDTGYPEVDAWIVDQNSDTIYYGTMWLLQRMPAKAFRDPVAARENGMIYSSAKSQARVDGMRTNVFGGQAWLYPQGFATITRKGWA